MRCWAGSRPGLGGWSHAGGPVFHTASNGLHLPLAGETVHQPTRSFDGPYQEVRSQGPVDCSTAPVAKKSWATAMA